MERISYSLSLHVLGGTMVFKKKFFWGGDSGQEFPAFKNQEISQKIS